jgi:hypothetical protein
MNDHLDRSNDPDQSRRRFEALRALLSQPDLPCLPSRVCTPRFSGDPTRQHELKRDLARAYVAYRTCEYWNADAEIVRVRRATTRLNGRRRAV